MANTPTFVPLADDAALDAAFTAPLAVVFKHSTTCSLSAVAYEEVAQYLKQPGAEPIQLVDLLAFRSISNAIETRSGVRHESPQVLILKDGAVVWNASHRRITPQTIAAAVAAARTSA